MSLKYKSPLIRSRNTSASNSGSGQNAVSSSPQTVVAPCCETAQSQVANQCDAVLVYDRTPQMTPVVQNWRGRGCSSPRFQNPRQSSPRPPWGSPYQWSSPNRFNNSWSSEQNNSSSSQEQNSYSSYRPHFNKYKKHNTNNWNSEKNDESYFHPSMLEDPWASLLSNSANNAE